MKEIKADDIAAAVRDLFLRANIEADPAVREALQSARLREEEKLPLCVLDCLGENLTVAAETGLPICQDTGMAVVFADIGVDVHLTGGCLQEGSCGSRGSRRLPGWANALFHRAGSALSSREHRR